LLLKLSLDTREKGEADLISSKRYIVCVRQRAIHKLALTGGEKLLIYT